MIYGILLAAGSASRFGSHKLLYPLPDGTPIGIAAARHLRQSVENIVVAVRPNDARLADLLHAEGMTTIVSEHAELGIGASLVSAINATENADGWLITLADMPWIQPQTISAIARMLEQGAEIAAPYYDGKRGHPVGFSRRFLPDFLSLTGDKGACDLLRNHPDLLEPFHCHDAGTLTPALLNTTKTGDWTTSDAQIRWIYLLPATSSCHTYSTLAPSYPQATRILYNGAEEWQTKY